jgi:hypothetical protein
MARLRDRLTYANVVATLACFMALGGTSYAVLHIGSRDVVDNSLRSRDIRDNTVRSRDIRDRTLRARDLKRDSLGKGVVKESALGKVPLAVEAERLGGASADDLRLKCPADTVAKTGACIESTPRSAAGFLGAVATCNQAERGLATMVQLDSFARSNGPLAQPEWTSSVYRNTDNGDVSYDRVYLAVQHPFRCVALPSN